MHYSIRDMHHVMANLNLTLHYIAKDVVTFASNDASILLRQLQDTNVYSSENISILRELLNRVRHRPSERWSWKLIYRGYNALTSLLFPTNLPISIFLHLNELKLDVYRIIRNYCRVIFNPQKCIPIFSGSSHGLDVGLVCQLITHIPQNFELASDEIYSLDQPIQVQDLIETKWKFSRQPMKIVLLSSQRVYVPRCINWNRNELIVMYRDQLLALDAKTQIMILKQPPYIISYTKDVV